MIKEVSTLYRKWISKIEEYNLFLYNLKKEIYLNELNSETTLSLSCHWLLRPDRYDSDWDIQLRIMWDYLEMKNSLRTQKKELLDFGIWLEKEIIKLKIDNIDFHYKLYIEEEKSQNSFWFEQSKRNVGVLDENWKEVIFKEEYEVKYSKDEILRTLQEQLSLLELKSNEERLQELSKIQRLTLIWFSSHPVYWSRYDITWYFRNKKKKIDNYIDKFFNKEDFYITDFWIFSKEGVKETLEQYKKIKKRKIFQDDINYYEKKEKEINNIKNKYSIVWDNIYLVDNKCELIFEWVSIFLLNYFELEEKEYLEKIKKQKKKLEVKFYTY